MKQDLIYLEPGHNTRALSETSDISIWPRRGIAFHNFFCFERPGLPETLLHAA